MVLDTNILIGYLNGDSTIIESLSQLKQSGQVLFISAISYAEVLAYPQLTETERQIVRNFLDTDIAEQAAKLRRNHNISLPDAIIAAQTATLNVPLITRDKQLKRLKEIQVVLI